MQKVSAHDVAAELRRLLPGIGVKKLHKLLYYCQGHHLAHFRTPLFAESIMAYDMGPMVAQLWKAEKEGRSPESPISLDNAQLNTVVYVVSRYGRLSGTDLERLTHAETPWQEADKLRTPGSSVRIRDTWIRDFFAAENGQDSESAWPSAEDIARLAVGATDRRNQPAVPDDLQALEARLSAR